MFGNKYVLGLIGVGILIMGAYNIYFFYQRRIPPPQKYQQQAVAPAAQTVPASVSSAVARSTQSFPVLTAEQAQELERRLLGRPEPKPKEEKPWGRNPFHKPSEVEALKRGPPAAEKPGDSPAATPALSAPVAPTAAPTGFVLSTISASGDRAIINKQTVRVGDVLGDSGWKVVQIRSDAVVVEKEGRRQTLARPAR